MIGFLIFYFISLVLIFIGIWKEEKLVRFERALAAGLRQTWQEWREAHDAA